MISNVCLTGSLGELINGTIYRYVNVDRPVPKDRQFVIDKIPVCHWSKTHKSQFSTLPVGACISLSGRLEKDDDVGIVIVLQEYLVLSRESTIQLKEGD